METLQLEISEMLFEARMILRQQLTCLEIEDLPVFWAGWDRKRGMWAVGFAIDGHQYRAQSQSQDTVLDLVRTYAQMIESQRIERWDAE